MKRYFVGFEVLKFISCMVFMGSENTITVSNSRQELVPQPVKLPRFTGDRRSKPKRRPSDEIPLRDIQHDKIDTEKGPTDSEESWEYNEVINPDWEVERRAGLYIVGWYGPDDPEVSPAQVRNKERAVLNPNCDVESTKLVCDQEAVCDLRSVLAHVRSLHCSRNLLFCGR